MNRGNKSTSTSTVLSSSSLDNMVIPTTGFHCRALQRLAPPNVSGSAWMRLEIGFNWHKSCVDAIQPSTIFWLQPISGTSHEIFIPGRDEKNMKKTGISLKTCHCSFQWRTALKKESKVGPQPCNSTSGVGTSFSKVLGPKKPGYGMGNNYIKLEQCVILYWVCSPT